MKKNSVLRAHNLQRIFTVGKSTVNALLKVELEIYQGEFIVVMGRSGSGKTTLLNVLGGLDSPTGGEYLLTGVKQQIILRNHMQPSIEEKE